MFSTSRKTAQQTAQRLISGHCALIAWWTLRHAGVFDAMAKLQEEGEGLDPLVYATRTNMAADVLSALLDYLASAGLVVFKGTQAFLTAEGESLMEHGDAVLNLIRGYEPVLETTEHLLAKLRASAPGTGNTTGRKSEYLVEAQAKRHAAEVFPAIRDVIGGHKLTHLLDIACGSGDLLVFLANKLKQIVGVGIGADPFGVRKANGVISDAGLEKRLIAVTANPVEVCNETKRTFDRIGISRQLWNELDCLIATGVFSEMASNSADAVAAVTAALAATRKNFPKAKLLIAEPVASQQFAKNFYAPELSLLLRLTRSTPWAIEAWREAIAAARLVIIEELMLTTDGMTLFLCK